MLTRRELLERGVGACGAAALGPLIGLAGGCAGPRSGRRGVVVNDVHSQLNRTRVRRVERPGSVEELQAVLHAARAEGLPVSMAGGRHAMGGQQFAEGGVLLDTTGLDRIGALDRDRGVIEAGAGVQWPELIEHLVSVQQGQSGSWGIVQKQTGADRLCLGGSLAANVHGRGLRHAPIVADVEEFTLVDAQGGLHRCSRRENPELFALAIGGYGLFGPIASVRLRLAPRRKLVRVVEIVDTADLGRRFEERIREGCLYGDCQYSTDLASEAGLRRGVFSCYRPVPDSTPMPGSQRRLSREDWLELITLAHRDRARAFEFYADYYASTSGQVYWSDTHQLSTYIDDYHVLLAQQRIGPFARGTEMISEIYVPRDALQDFLESVRADFLAHAVDLVYGTIRLIERDEESFLAWARQPWACVIFNLHTEHDPAALDATRLHFQRLIDRGLEHGGSYFLTYHRWARPDQVVAAHPRLPEFLRLKRHYDPEERFQSEWYRHYRERCA